MTLPSQELWPVLVTVFVLGAMAGCTGVVLLGAILNWHDGRAVDGCSSNK